MARFGEPGFIGTVDISHFRAPYKNFPGMNGFGALIPGGADPAAASQESAIGQGDLFTVDKNGVSVLTLKGFGMLSEALPVSRVIFLDNDNVKFEGAAPSDTRKKASTWVAEKLAEGKSIVFGSPAGLVSAFKPIVVDRVLMAVSGTKGELDKAGPQSRGLSAVAARPKTELATAGMGTFGWALLIGAVVGVVAVTAKRKRRAVANPRRHRRARR